MKENKLGARNSFSGQIGFVLAAAGSAVGLGNIWRFPYLAAEYGGGIFLLVYVILLVTFGAVLMLIEISIGRKTGLSAIGAFKKLNKKFAFLGVLAALVPMIILPYYSVIGGWVLKYLSAYVTGQGSAVASDEFFGGYISQTYEPLGWLLLFIGVTALIVFLGVEKGIEKASKFMMPVLIVLMVGITAYTLTRPGAFDGVLFYITPDFSKFSIMTVVAALGQLFYSMSLAMGIMITFGSYLKKDANIKKSVRQIEIFDTGIAFLAGLMIIPAVFAFSGGNEESINAGAGLMFVTMPKVFADFQFGEIIGGVFFLLVAFAALTSTISLMETIVSIFCDKFKWKRRPTCLVVALACFLLAIPSSLGFGVWDSVQIIGLSFLDFFDFISNGIIMPLVALFTCIFVGYVIKPQSVISEIRSSGTYKSEKFFTIMVKYVAPVFLLVIFITEILKLLGVVTV